MKFRLTALLSCLGAEDARGFEDARAGRGQAVELVEARRDAAQPFFVGDLLDLPLGQHHVKVNNDRHHV